MERRSWDVKFVQLLEWSIPGNTFYSRKIETSDEIDQHISKLAGSVVQIYKTKIGRAGKELQEREKVFHVNKRHVKAANQWRGGIALREYS